MQKGTDALVEVLNQVERFSRDNAVAPAEQKFERKFAEELSALRSVDLAGLDSRRVFGAI